MPHAFFDLIALAELGCWGVCFWWMHRISVRQDSLLAQLQRQGERIEKISKEEHRILTELHPTVKSIEKGVQEVSNSVA
jgi:hypothetical protein